MKKLIIMFVALTIPFMSFSKGDLIPKGSKVYIVPMEGNLNQFIAGEILKKKIPLVIVTEDKGADYVMTGNSIKKDGNNKWYHVLSGTAGMTDTVQASISLINVKTKAVVWADNAGDRSAWWGVLKRGGERKVAERLAKDLKKTFTK